MLICSVIVGIFSFSKLFMVRPGCIKAPDQCEKLFYGSNVIPGFNQCKEAPEITAKACFHILSNNSFVNFQEMYHQHLKVLFVD